MKIKLCCLLNWILISALFISCVDEESFDGAIENPIENVEAIDLGLPSGTLWANCNIGAFDVMDYGDYFAWGEVSPRKKYSVTEYLHYEPSDYGYSRNIGKNIVATKYDAAKEQWGEEWCLPTTEDFNELIRNCSWSWIKYENSVWGYKVEGTNGNWIFLPASGYYEESSIEKLDFRGGYWSSNMYEDTYDYANALQFSADGYGVNKYERFYGLAIRPVKNKYSNLNNDNVDFNYEVADSKYKLDFYVVSQIRFNNMSNSSGNVKWDFGTSEDGYTADLADVNHPVVKYKKPGLYNVTLTIEGVGSRTYPILINEITPIVSISEQSNNLIVLNDSKVTFNVELPNPENKRVKYIWKFPEGTKDASGNLITSAMEFTTDPGTGAIEYPQNISFSNLGSQRVTVDAIFDYGSAEVRQLEQSYIDVQVASPIEAPTLYYAQVGGNIKAMKLLSDEELASMGNPKVFPYDLGVSSGENPFNILYGSTSKNEHWIYILDAGKQYYYVKDEGGVLGDGKITAMRADGTNVNTVITNVGGAAFSDPFQGNIYDGYIYYNDRNQGFSKVKMTERGLVEKNIPGNNTILRENYIVRNELIPYYNRGIAYGAISTGIYRDKSGIWWWGKNYSGNGIYRFKDTDIYTTSAAAASAAIPYPTVLQSIKFTSYTLDEDRGKLYIWGIHGAGKGAGFVEYPLPAPYETVGVNEATGYVNMEAKAVNTTADEQVYVKQLTVDARNGRVYFGFRADEGDVWSTAGNGHTGIVYYDPETQKCQNYGETHDEILGVTINPTLSKLF